MEDDVSAVEDLMREHGILNRILLIYEELIGRLRRDQKIDYRLVYICALMIRKFVEDYHEKTEETYIFPLLLKHNDQTVLINELIEQHVIGRKLTDNILKFSKSENKEEVILNTELFIKMYRAHEAREDTVVFWAIKKYMSKKDYGELSELFEKEEEQKLGKHGFERILEDIEKIEKKLNIYDISIISRYAKRMINI